ncbi:pimeloyl-ACP methyl ester carboxylesterase [Microbacterium sp. W4I4]|uniref:alpha/beta fold hydrolase n=1 Tax=Microbacterium sp. W4I4 TaxID=3042295 RepID=UPI002780DE8B|nr:alpha/beta fold hydrolase [Microbacterium sp. W4I4]MDQ0615919.1 pimeloyl-ACP methyl ester carboxylesterase [Microbacterium sp. W4I4]
MDYEDGRSGGAAQLYYQWHGRAGDEPPLLLVHGGGSTIESNWGALIPALAGTRRILAVELQGHGRTPTGSGPASFERSADDLAALLIELDTGPVHVLGFSNGGQVSLQLAIRHPERVARLIAASAPFRRDGMIDGFWDAMATSGFADMPEVYRQADIDVSGDVAHAERMFALDRDLMTGFHDFPDDSLATIVAPTLVVAGDRDVITRDHAVALAALVPGARLLIVPGGHGDYLGEAFAADGDLRAMSRALPLLTGFLDDEF